MDWRTVREIVGIALAALAIGGVAFLIFLYGCAVFGACAL